MDLCMGLAGSNGAIDTHYGRSYVWSRLWYGHVHDYTNTDVVLKTFANAYNKTGQTMWNPCYSPYSRLRGKAQSSSYGLYGWENVIATWV